MLLDISSCFTSKHSSFLIDTLNCLASRVPSPFPKQMEHETRSAGVSFPSMSWNSFLDFGTLHWRLSLSEHWQCRSAVKKKRQCYIFLTKWHGALSCSSQILSTVALATVDGWQSRHRILVFTSNCCMFFGVSTGVEVQRFVMVSFCFCLQSDYIIRSVGGLSKSSCQVCNGATQTTTPSLWAVWGTSNGSFEYSTIKWVCFLLKPYEVNWSFVQSSSLPPRFSASSFSGS